MDKFENFAETTKIIHGVNSVKHHTRLTSKELIKLAEQARAVQETFEDFVNMPMIRTTQQDLDNRARYPS